MSELSAKRFVEIISGKQNNDRELHTLGELAAVLKIVRDVGERPGLTKLAEKAIGRELQLRDAKLITPRPPWLDGVSKEEFKSALAKHRAKYLAHVRDEFKQRKRFNLRPPRHRESWYRKFFG